MNNSICSTAFQTPAIRLSFRHVNALKNRFILTLLLVFSVFIVKAQTQTPCPNLINNGDFEGNTSTFTTPLPTGCSSCTTGSYCVVATFANKCNLWPTTFDHTFMNSTGHFMAIDGQNSTVGTTDIWRNVATITVVPGKTYKYSVYVKSIFPASQQVFDLEMAIIDNSTTIATATHQISQTPVAWTKYTMM